MNNPIYKDDKEKIDNVTYLEMLYYLESSKTRELIEGETGLYFSKKIAEKRHVISREHVSIFERWISDEQNLLETV